MSNKITVKCMRCGNTFEISEQAMQEVGYTKSHYCEACLEIGLQALRGYKPHKFIKVKDLLIYCNKKVEEIEKARAKNREENNANISVLCQTDEHLSKELCRWRYDIPKMIEELQAPKR